MRFFIPLKFRIVFKRVLIRIKISEYPYIFADNKMIMKNTFILLILLIHGFTPSCLVAQDIYVTSGTTCQLSAGTTFSVNGLTLVNSSVFDLNGLSITKNTTLTNSAGSSPPASVGRYYLFSATTPSFSGTVKVNYLDAELNGITESVLEVNNYTGSAWTYNSSNVNDVTNNYVLSNALSGVTLREIALASSAAPLPVTWLNFTATKQGNGVMLHWSTAQEINSRDYMVQHSLNGQQFTDLTTQAAAGNSSTILHYTYLNTKPFLGSNYYRICQRDFNGAITYSAIRYLNFSAEPNSAKDLHIIANPIQGNELQIMTQSEEDISIYNMVGQLFFEKHFDKGIHTIDMSHFEIGTYLLRTNTTTIKLLKL